MKYEIVFCKEVLRVQVDDAKDEFDAATKSKQLPEVKELIATMDSADVLTVQVMEVP